MFTLTEDETMYRDAKLSFRRIFDGQIEFSEHELTKLQEFRQYLQRHRLEMDTW